ncbi:MAG: prephenate dehydrogenase/arogenate dehydrogenase family protein [Fimbriimonadia bacterium]|nr:prephenate dehydrogenase/arogenate dehydrogenase family protein [Fimbriimonadia bacterium]
MHGMSEINVLGIVGLGGIGASVGMAAKQRGLAQRVVGVDVDQSACQAAVEAGASDEAGQHLSRLKSAGFVVIAVPPEAIIPVLSQLAAYLPPSAIVTDVGSVKSEIVRAARAIKPDFTFVGGHPMAGTERSGIEAARADLFVGAPWIVTPDEQTSPDALAQVEQVAFSLGAVPVAMTAETHDQHVGLLSHLPNLLAAALLRLSAQLDHTELGGGSWRDLTRVGGSDPALWTQILGMNRAKMLTWIDALLNELTLMRGYLSAEQNEQVTAYWESARRLKEKNINDF